MLTAQISRQEQLENENKVLRKEVAVLQERLDWFQRQLFGKRSEKIVKDLNQNALYFEGFEPTNEPKTEEKKKITYERRQSKKKGGDRIVIPQDLPVETTIIDIPEEKKVCPETGVPLVKIGEEVTHKLAHKPGSFYIKEIIRPKYAMPKGSEEGIEVAVLPDSFIPKCRADESFLAEILTKKFADHIPLCRIIEGLSRLNIRISKQLLSQWVVRIGKQLKPLYDLMVEKILKSENIFVDETPINMLMPGKGKAHQSFMWVLAGGKERDPPYRVYQFYLNRKHENITNLIGDYKGVLHSDKYGAYEKLAKQEQIIWCPCWSHIRRKFFDVESGDLNFCQWVLRKIRYLFMFERVAWTRSEEERLRIRQEKETPIIDELIEKIKNKLIDGKILPKSKFKEALGYFCSLIPFLKNYTTSPWARLDNNVAERAVRPLAIGRKNWMFMGSLDGGEAAAVIFSLVQTCRALKINPREYLEDILRRFMSHPYNKLEELLPNNWIKTG